MARSNTRAKAPVKTTHEGAPAALHITPLQQLRRTVLSCFLFEGQFYEDGISIDQRIQEYAAKVPVRELSDLAVEARHEHNLRHVSLRLLLCLLARSKEWDNAEQQGRTLARVVDKVVARADEVSELVAMYWKDGKKPLPASMKKGLALALNRFSAYQLSKYNRDNAVKLRDVLFLVHAKPKDEERAVLFKKLAEGTLESADTWEVALSSGADKKETFEKMIKEGTLGYFALLRNLRNMEAAGVNRALVRQAILDRKNGAEKLLPFRFTAAARQAKVFERELDTSMMVAIDALPKLPGRTALLIDVSGSMGYGYISGKSDMTFMDAAATLGSMVNGDDVDVYTFSNNVVQIPPRRGMAGVDAIIKSQAHGGTDLGGAVTQLNKKGGYDRLIVITDEQSSSRVPAPSNFPKAYLINVASARNGVGYGPWVHIDGFSEKVLQWIYEYEQEQKDGHS